MNVFADYINALGKNLDKGDATEHTHRPALKVLLECAGQDIVATNEPRRIVCGAPDFNITRKNVPLGHLETKDAGSNLAEMERGKGPNGAQFKRYAAALSNWILTDYLEFRWYVAGEKRLTVRVAELDANGRLKPVADGEKQLAELLTAFYEHPALTVATAHDLAGRMAGMTRILRGLIVASFEHEPDAGWLHEWLRAFRETLIPDLDAEQFADMFAQTLAYGLFAARVHAPPGKPFSREVAAFNLPKTNPFLRKLFAEIAGVDMPETIAWAVDDLVALLQHADFFEILKDFGKGQGKEDPVVHFYETFLAAYDPKMREVRGVYYTPEPVVSYIVRSIDHLLKKDFSRPKGLADENTLILDPATGTATFLYFVIAHIHQSFSKQLGAWDGYVEKHLLNRIFGFELLMAPYSIAHLKLGMQLQETGYQFASDQRLGIFLTNSLEEAAQKSEHLFARWISDEANAAARIKRDKKIMVVLGNPPYSGISANHGDWITGLLDDYRYVDGQPLGEKKVWLKNDYVKFLRFGQWRIEQTGHGILAFITDHSYLDSPTFRGMRANLMKTFNEIYILNLHGNSKRRETAPDGGKDENVFDITQGVAIAVFVKHPAPDDSHHVLRYGDLWGERAGKYKQLLGGDVSRTTWKTLRPAAPFFEFVPVKHGVKTEYQSGWSIKDVFMAGSNGVQTSRDSLVVGYGKETLAKNIEAFCDAKKSDAEVRSMFFGNKQVGDYLSGDTREWKLGAAREILQKNQSWRTAIINYQYRPFDTRALLYFDAMVDWPRRDIMQHLELDNLALCVGRAGLVASGPWALAFCTSSICDHNLFYRGSSLNFPLYFHEDHAQKKDGWNKALTLALFEATAGYQTRRANIAPSFVKELSARLKCDWLQVGRGDLKKTIGPEDAFAYIYAVIHSPTYRTRYAEFLKIDFPRLPLTGNRKLFAALAGLGKELVELHVMESSKLNDLITEFSVKGASIVEKVQYTAADQRVWINAQQYFGGVPKTVWEFRIGGYQVCEKWLKDRKGRTLIYDDIQHYQKIVVALSETIRLMAGIDNAIAAHGGWPDAFGASP